MNKLPQIIRPKVLQALRNSSSQITAPPFQKSRIKPGQVSKIRKVPSVIKRPPYMNTQGQPNVPDAPKIMTDRDIEGMRKACQLASYIRRYAGSLVKVGRTTEEIDQLVHKEIVSCGAYPSTLGYMGYPKSLCTSVNEVMCHGIPDSRPLEQYDIVKLDITVYHAGYHGDTCGSWRVGVPDNLPEDKDPDPVGRRLVQIAKECTEAGIAACKPFQKFNVIGNAVGEHAEKHGFKIAEDFCGHGIGHHFHCPPNVYYHKNDLPLEEVGADLILPGMTFTIEPLVHEGELAWEEWGDQWTTVTLDGGRTAQFEHTVLITDTGAEVLTR